MSKPSLHHSEKKLTIPAPAVGKLLLNIPHRKPQLEEEPNDFEILIMEESSRKEKRDLAILKEVDHQLIKYEEMSSRVHKKERYLNHD